MSTPAVTGSKGPVKLGKLLGKGGEGTVYEVVDQPAMVAKLYTKDMPAERAEKLRVMPQLLTPKLASLTAWPHDILRGGGGKVVGFLMPKINAHDVHEVYGPKSRQRIFPQADWRLLVRTALNTARGFAVVHEAGILVADVNHGGVMVSADATVRLIDCDSFQITTGAKTFLCEVGVEDFTPPELQGGSFRGVVRATNHDNFGLAVLIFRLLMLGRHPFAGRHLGKGDLSIGEAIAQCKYAYSREKSRTQMEAPPATPPVLVAGQEISLLWEQAFSPTGKQSHGRPTAEQWVFALTKLEANFAKCPSHGGHYFARGITCPWCPIQMGTGSPPFPLPASHVPPVPAGGPFSLESVWAQITSVQPPPAAQPAMPSARGVPSAEAQSYASKKGTYKGLAWVGAIGIFLGGVLALEINWVWCAFAAWATYAMFAGMAPSVDKVQYRQRKTTAENQLRSLTDRWMKEASSQPFEAKLSDLRRRRDELLQLPAARQAQYGKLVANRESAAKKKFLDKFEIEKASISGIGPAKKSMLESYGIETAADVKRNAVMNVPGFGPALTTRLLDWRKSVEARFRFDANAAVDPRDFQDLDQAIAQRKRQIEEDLRKGATELHHLRTTILSQRQALDGPIRAAAQALAQAEADLSAVQ